MHNNSGIVRKKNLFTAKCGHPCSTVLQCVRMTDVWEKPIEFTEAVIWPFLWITLTKKKINKKFDRNTEPLLQPKTSKSLSLGYIHLLSIDLCFPFPSFSVACCCCITKIFFLECPRMFTMSSTLKHLR